MLVARDIAEHAGTQSDSALMRHVAEGDPRAQRVLAHRLAPRVHRLSTRLLSNRADADDASQIALMEILRSAGGFRQEASIERWADRIAVRCAIRHAREQRRGPFGLLSPTDADQLRDRPRATAAEATPRAIEDYLDELPEARRQVLVLKHALGYTAEEIAELTGKPVGTVKDRLVAARKQLRKVIQRELRIGVRGGAVKHD